MGEHDRVRICVPHFADVLGRELGMDLTVTCPVDDLDVGLRCHVLRQVLIGNWHADTESTASHVFLE